MFVIVNKSYIKKLIVENKLIYDNKIDSNIKIEDIRN